MFRNRLVLQTAPDAGGGAGGGGAPNGAPPNGSAANQDWFPAEHKEFVSAKGWKGPADVITSAQNLEKLLGADRAGRTVVLPKDDKDVEGRKAFYAKIGVPDKAEAYETPDTLKDDPMLPAAREAALEFGIPAPAFKGFLGKVLAHAEKLRTDAEAKAKTDSEAELNALRGEWGGSFDANAELGRRIVRAAGMTEDDLGKIEGALGTSKFLKMFHALGTKIAEPAPGGGQNNGSGGNTLTAEAAQKKIAELRQQRLENKISEKEFLAETDRLGPIAYPQQ